MAMRDEFVVKSIRYDENDEEIVTYAKRKPRHPKGSAEEYYNNYVQRYISREAENLMFVLKSFQPIHESLMTSVLRALSEKFHDLDVVSRAAGALDLFYLDCDALKKQLARIQRSNIAIDGVKIFKDNLEEAEVFEMLDKDTLHAFETLGRASSRIEDISRVSKKAREVAELEKA